MLKRTNVAVGVWILSANNEVLSCVTDNVLTNCDEIISEGKHIKHKN